MSELLDFGVVLGVLLAYHYRPSFIYGLGSSMWGRSLLILTVAAVACRDLLAGLAMAFLCASVLANVREGFEGSVDDEGRLEHSRDWNAKTGYGPTDSASDVLVRPVCCSKTVTEDCTNCDATDLPSGMACNDDGQCYSGTCSSTLFKCTSSGSPSSAPSGSPPSAPSAPSAPSGSPSSAPSAPSGSPSSGPAPPARPPSNIKDEASFRAAYCRKDEALVDPKGKMICLGDIEQSFPYVTFPEGGICDPCRKSCKFSVTDRLSIDEALRPTSTGTTASSKKANAAPDGAVATAATAVPGAPPTSPPSGVRTQVPSGGPPPVGVAPAGDPPGA